VHFSRSRSWRDRVIPVAVKGVRLDPQTREFGVGDLDLGFIALPVDGGADDQAGACRGAGDETHDRLMAHQGPAAPVVRDETEQPMLDLVPLAGTGREVTDGELQA